VLYQQHLSLVNKATFERNTLKSYRPLGADAVHSDNFFIYILKNLPSTLAININSTGSETSANFYHPIHRQIPEESNLQIRRLEKIGFRIIDMFEMQRVIN